MFAKYSQATKDDNNINEICQQNIASNPLGSLNLKKEDCAFS